MIFAEDQYYHRIKATKDREGFCPITHVKLVACVGKIIAPYWRYPKGFDRGESAPETQWHIDSKLQFPEEFIEVVVDNHRADIQTPHHIVEVQHSSINYKDMLKREEAYGPEMIWLFDMREPFKNKSFSHPNQDGIPDPIERFVNLRWKHPSKAKLMSSRDCWFDFGNTNSPMNDSGEFYYLLAGYEIEDTYYYQYETEGKKVICHFLLMEKFEWVKSIVNGTYHAKVAELKTIMPITKLYNKDDIFKFNIE